MPDTEVREFPRGVQPLLLDGRDVGARRSGLTPDDEAPQLCFVTFRQQLDGAIVGVANPAARPNPIRAVHAASRHSYR